MNAIVLLGTLKRSGLSNTQTLCEFLVGRMEREGVRSEIVKLAEHRILPGTYSDMGAGDEWPAILEKILGQSAGAMFGNAQAVGITIGCMVAVRVLLGVAHLVVPVAVPALVAEVGERVLVLRPPGVELLVVLRLEVLAVHRVAAARVRVGRDDGVPAVVLVAHRAPSRETRTRF